MTTDFYNVRKTDDRVSCEITIVKTLMRKRL